MTESSVAASVREPLAVVGLSCLFPKAAGVEEFWSNIRDGVDAITEIPSTHWKTDEYFDADPKSPDRTYAKRGGFLSPVAFDPLDFGIAPSNLEAIDTSQLLGLVAAKCALDDAGYGPDRQFDRSRVGCILGVTGTLEMVIPLGARLGHPKWRQALKDAGVADDVAEDVIQRISDSYVPWQENSFPGLLGNVVAGRIANRLDLGGTNCVVDAACASSLSAMHLAALELWSGRSDMVVTGGIDTFNDIFMYMCFSKTPALSPTGDAKPFSEHADGTILGEGVGIFVLKRLADAQRDGDQVYAVIRGIGTSSDGAGSAVYAPKKEGQVRCLQDAYRLADVSPDTVELIEAHGTGTKVGDATELAGLTEVFRSPGKSGGWCAVGSIKSQIGHTKAAAGAAGVLKAILALKQQVLPPTIKIDRPLPELLDDGSPLYANTLARPWLPQKHHPRRAGVSAFGFGGSNFHCVLEEAPKSRPVIDWQHDIFFAALSAETRESLAAQLGNWLGIADHDQLRRQAASSRGQFQSSHEHRLVIVAEERGGGTLNLIAAARDRLTAYGDRSSWTTPDGISYSRGRAIGKLGLLFPGQGSQYVNMQRELACRFPMLREVLAEANDIFASFASPPRPVRLSDYIYPIPAFDDRTRDKQEAALRDTEIAQPALGAVSLGLLAVLAEFGVTPDVVAGHSYGELTALCASKRFAPEALYRLSLLRGRLMAEAQEIEGGMLAVGASLSQVEAALQESAVDLVIANRNSPTQVVLSGRIAELDRASEVLARRNIRGKRLPVAAAFHSPLVATASHRFRPVLDEIEFFAPEIPVYGNTLAEEYPDDPAEARSLLAGQLAQPVEFVRQVENMYAAGVRTFLEVGPGAVLTSLVNSILSGRDFRAVAVDSSAGKRSGLLDLTLALGQLAVSGCPVTLSNWDPLPGDAPTGATTSSQRLTVPIGGANYVKPRTPRPPRITSPTRGPETGGQSTMDSGQRQQPAEARLPARPAVDDFRLAVVPQPSTLNLQASSRNPQPSGLLVLQQMFEQTARLHQQFLSGQERALETLERLAGGPPLTAAVTAPQVLPATPGQKTSDQRQGENEAEVSSGPFPLASRPTSDAPPSAVNPQLAELTIAVLEVVAEKTGYPVEMLKPEMSLDHDLGIDSIKRVEILSALQERRPDLPAVKPEQLGTLHRLEDVIALLGTSMGREAQAEERPLSYPQASTLNLQRATRLTVGVPRSTPLATPRRSVPLPAASAIVVTDDGTNVSQLVAERLAALGHQPRLVPWQDATTFSPPGELAGLILISPMPRLSDQQLWQALEWAQQCGPVLRRCGQKQGAILATVSRLDGQFGWGGGATGGDALSGALAGLAKTARHEWPEVTSTAFDLPSGTALSDNTIERLVDQILSAGPSEIGVSDAGLRQIDVVERRMPDHGEPPVRPGELILITGGARGVTAACALAVAKAWRPRLVLCGRTPLAAVEPDWLVSLPSPAQIKQALAQHAAPGTPLRQIDRQCRQVLANREIRAALDAIRRTGAGVEYIAADIRDQAAVQEMASEIQRRHGPIRGVIHGAGVLEDRRIEDKTREQFDNVFSTKVVGLRNVLGAVEPDELRLLALFSSYTGRFGRTGQVDYAMANEALNKLAAQFQRSHPRCRTRSFNWGPWDGGMVTDALKPLFEQEGVGLIPLEDGADLLVRELERADANDVELVILATRQETSGERREEDATVLHSRPTYPASRPAPDVPPSVVNPQLAELTTAVLEVVAEKTGYPAEMLKPEMSLDHDLGIDSIKRVEILSALQERRPDLPAVKPEQLGTLHRLEDVIALLGTSMGREAQAEGRSQILPQPSTFNPQPSTGRVGWERSLDVSSHPYLASHVIGGKAVLPTAMIVECLAHAALHHHPGLELLGLSQLHIFKGVRIDRGERQPLKVFTDKAVRTGGEYRVPTRLISSDTGREVLHARAEISLGSERSHVGGSRLAPLVSQRLIAPPANWYDRLLFHGPQLQGLERIEAIGPEGIVVWSQSASAPPTWMTDPWRGAWLADPLAIDVLLQAIIVWTQTVCERASLPTAIGEYRQYRRTFPHDGVRIAVLAQRTNDAAVRADAEILDATGEIIAELTGIEYVLDAQLSAAFQRNRLE